MESYPILTGKIKDLINKRANGSVRKFSQMINLSSSQKLNRLFNVDKRNNKYPEPSIDIIQSIANTFDDIDLNWLLKDKEWKSIKSFDFSKKEKGIPYYGDSLEWNIDFQEMDPGYFIDCEPLNDCDFYTTYHGDAMKGEIDNGDILALKQMKNTSLIIYGDIYLIVTESDSNSLVLVFTVRKHVNKEYITLQPANKLYDEIDLPIDQIKALYKVKGRICRK